MAGVRQTDTAGAPAAAILIGPVAALVAVAAQVLGAVSAEVTPVAALEENFNQLNSNISSKIAS